MYNVTTFLDNHARAQGRIAVIAPSKGEEYSYADLLSWVSCIARDLASQGVSKGDRVCIFLDSSPAYLAAYFAIWRLGAVAVPATISYREDELCRAMADAGARGLVHGDTGSAVAAAVLERIPDLPAVINLDAGVSRQDAEGIIPPVPCGCADICQIQYTSGTTGIPKGAMLTHGNWMAALEAEREALSLASSDRYLGIYPMGHVGVSWGISVLRAGGTYVIMERFDLDSYLDFSATFRVSVLSGMPPVIYSLCTAPAGAEDALGTVRVMISGGGPLPPQVWESFERRYSIPIANAYGLSETVVIGTGTITVPGIPALTGNYHGVGVPAAYTEIKIVDPGNPRRSLPTGEDGEIALRGPSVAQGYWNMPGETAESFLPDGWFLSGDIGHLDENGILFVTDRKKDMIIMSGWKIYPTEVENSIRCHPAVEDAAVFGCPDERRGEIPVAAVVIRDEALSDPGLLGDFCRDRMAGYKVPRKFIVVRALPRVHGWKLMRRKLQEAYCPMKAGEDLL